MKRKKKTTRKENMSVAAARLISELQWSRIAAASVGSDGAAAQNLQELKSKDNVSANMNIDRNTKGGLAQSHPSCVNIQQYTDMYRAGWGQAGDGVWEYLDPPPHPFCMHANFIIVVFPCGFQS